MVYDRTLQILGREPLLPNGTREMLNVYLRFDPFKQLKRAKQAYVDAELSWYLSMECNIKGHPRIEDNPIWQNCAAPNGSVNSNYGWCVFSGENWYQYTKAVEALQRDSWSRQSCCVYIRPDIQYTHNDQIHAHHDFICTFCTHHFIRDCKLEYIVYMRSNDVEYGLPYDLAWHQYVYKKMLDDLGVYEPGLIHWHASSLHKYEKQSNAGASCA